MEKWSPLMDIFINSPLPEREALLWLQQDDPSRPPALSSFLSLLLQPSSSSSSNSGNGCIWLQTLPNVVQARIISFLAIESTRFCCLRLRKIASTILQSELQLDFWIQRAACNLLLAVSPTFNIFSFSLEEEDFMSLPHWLLNRQPTSESLFPWLPFAPKRLPVKDFQNTLPVQGEEVASPSEIEEVCENVVLDAGSCKSAEVHSEVDSAPDPEIQSKATELKSQLLVSGSLTTFMSLADQIQQLCSDDKGTSTLVLDLLEPWAASDELVPLLLSNLSAGTQEFPWSAHVVAAVLLPKLIFLHAPASRVLTTAAIDYCRIHQRAAVEGLLLPLLLLKEGINVSHGDFLSQIIKECLKPAHVSALVQKLLCDDGSRRSSYYLPRYRCLISEKLVWTEAVFTLFQNILNHNIYFTQDSVDRVVCGIDEMADKLSRSLKLGNFLGSLVGKCSPLLKSHKLLLLDVAKRTDTFLTPSLLSKLCEM